MKHKKKKRITWFKALLIAFIIVLLIRFFAFQSFAVKSSSMSGSLLTGDWVLINKLEYGTRMPNTLLFLPFAERNELSSKHYYLKWPQLRYRRLEGFSKINRNDILAFNYPEETEIPVDKRVVYLKRCVGLSGDTILFQKNELYINKKFVYNPNTQFSYRVRCKTKHFEKELILRNQYQEGGKINNQGDLLLYLTEVDAKNISNNKEIIAVNRENIVYNLYSASFFPSSPYFKWTGSDFGPIVVPKKGDTVEINLSNIDIYKKIISNYEKHKLSILNNKILIDDKEVISYVFEMNYFFVLDDNRDNAKDSRKWGFLPEDHIIGKVNTVLFSFEKVDHSIKIRWNRFFRKI